METPTDRHSAIQFFVSFRMILISETLIDRPAKQVWEILTDPALFPKWQDGYESTVQISGAYGETGAQSQHIFIENNKKFIFIEETLNSDQPHRLELKRDSPVLTSIYTSTIQPDGEKSVLTTKNVVSFKAFSLKIFAPLMKRSFLNRQNADLQRLKNLIESMDI